MTLCTFWNLHFGKREWMGELRSDVGEFIRKLLQQGRKIDVLCYEMVEHIVWGKI